MRIVFCGTPEFAVAPMRRLAADPEISIDAVFSQPDRPRGRSQEAGSPPVKAAALEIGVPVHQPQSIKSEACRELLERIAPDAVVIIAYGQIIPAKFLTIPRLGWINLHGSLLPRYRGAAPIQWAIANGEQITGLTTMQIDAGMDTGPILLQESIAIGPDETTPELASRMSVMGAELVLRTLRALSSEEIAAAFQDGSAASYAPILKKQDGRIAWTRTAQQIYDRMRGFTPWPGAYSFFRGKPCQLWGKPSPASPAPGRTPGSIIYSSGTSSAILDVVCADDTALRITEVQLEGRRRTSAQDFANGARLTATDGFE